MKDSKRFIIWIIVVVCLVIFGPLIITSLFLTSSNFIHPLYFIGFLVIVAAIISYFGKLGR